MESFRAKRVVLGDGVRTPLRLVAAAIDIDGDRIVAVREDGEAAVDLGDVIVCPAYVNAHTHCALSAARGLADDEDLRGNMVESLYYRLETEMSPADVRAFARMGAYECLMTGTGLVWDHYYGGIELAEAFCDVGLAAVVGPTLQDVKGPGVSSLELQLAATLELESWSERGIWSALAPHATDTVSESLWQRVAELAEGRVIHSHLAQSVEEFEVSFAQHHCSPVEFLDRIGVLSAGPGLYVHMVFASGADLSRLDSERHTLGFCPLSASQFAFPAFVADWERWYVATDCASSNDSMNVQRELPVVSAMRALLTTGSDEYTVFRRTGSASDAGALDDRRKRDFDRLTRFNDPDFLLSRVWSVPGRLHPKFTAGVIETGALANLLVLDPRHPSLWPDRTVLRTLALADTQGAIEKMMVRGRWVKLPTANDADYLDARDEASRRLASLLKRI